MNTFKIREDGYKEIRKKTLLRTILFLSILVILCVTLLKLNADQGGESFMTLPNIIPIALLLIFFGFSFGSKRQKAIFDRYTLTIAENQVILEITGIRTVKINFSDISEIRKSPNGNITITGKNRDTIGIPPQIERYTELEQQLNDIKPISSKD